MENQGYLLLLFGFIVGGFLIVDLGYFNRKARKISPMSALVQSLFWITISLVFAALIFLFISREAFAEFLSAYLTEKMLSVDNLFVIMLIFSFFRLEEKYHHRVLFWGILGAVVLRGVFIVIGGVIVQEFEWILYVFGGLLIYTGIKLFSEKRETHIDFEKNKIVRYARKYLRFTANHHNGEFIAKENGKLYFTLLFLILLLVETTDVVFAVDSIPAAFAISQNAFIVFTSNIFAVMGLRALFFLLEGVLRKFHHLQKGLAFILFFIGIKMLAGIFNLHISSFVSLIIIMAVLALSLCLSVVYPKKI